MAAPNEINWADGDPSYREEPLDAKKDLGWVSEEKPPFQYFNWVLGTLAEWVTYLNDLSTTAQGANYLRSNDPITYSAGTITLVDFLELRFRDGASVYTNRIAAGTIALTDGQVLVAYKDTSSTTVTLSSGTYGTLAAGQYAVVAESSLSATNAENEVILFRRRTVSAGDDTYGVGYDVIECPVLGTQYLSGERFYLGGKDYGDIVVTDSKDINVYSGNKTGLVFTVDGSTGNFGVASGAKFFIDGTALIGDTYFREVSANNAQLVVGGSTSFQASSTLFLLGADLAVNATNKFYLDGASDTYFTESSANTISFFRGGTEQLRMGSGVNNFLAGNVYIAATNAIYLDGGTNTYIQEISSDLIQFVAGGNGSFYVGNNYAAVDSTDRFYLDGGSNTYIYESAADTLRLVPGGVTGAFILNTTSLTLGASIELYVSSGNRVYLDGGSDTSIRQSAANVITLETGGTDRFSISSSGLSLTVGFSSDVDPAASELYNLGSSSAYWASLHSQAITVYQNAGGTTTPGKIQNVGGIMLFEDSQSGGAFKGIGVDSSAPKIYPTDDNFYTLGDSTHRFVDVWAVDSSINTSDQRRKKNIEKSDLGLDFILKLNPVSFIRKDFNIDKEGKQEEIKYKRRHYGLIAQEVKAALSEKDFAGLVYDKDSDVYGLRYEEFIGPIIMAIHDIFEKIESIN